ncbi:MAG: segregation/condensation protein A, partial [Clostridia bacterium]|nr:segregation/condensation protein A [Clostridia bacterium]
DLQAAMLLEAFARILDRVRQEPPPPPEHEVTRDAITIHECALHIVRVLKEGPTLFSRLFEGLLSREKLVTTFLALLELLRQGTIAVRQAVEFGEIEVEMTGNERNPDTQG